MKKKIAALVLTTIFLVTMQTVVADEPKKFPQLFLDTWPPNSQGAYQPTTRFCAATDPAGKLCVYVSPDDHLAIQPTSTTRWFRVASGWRSAKVVDPLLVNGRVRMIIVGEKSRSVKELWLTQEEIRSCRFFPGK